MDQILDTQYQQENRPREFAGFWIRVGAYFIDAIVFTIGVWIFVFIVGGLFGITAGNFQPDQDSIIIGVFGFYGLIIIGYLLYFSLMESSEKQATLGKMAVGIRVGDRYGNRLSFANALGRTASKWLSWITLYIGFMMVGWDEHKQGLHDKIADTYVFYN